MKLREILSSKASDPNTFEAIFINTTTSFTDSNLGFVSLDKKETDLILFNILVFNISNHESQRCN